MQEGGFLYCFLVGEGHCFSTSSLSGGTPGRGLNPSPAICVTRPLSSELDQADEASKAELAVARTKARGLELQARAGGPNRRGKSSCSVQDCLQHCSCSEAPIIEVQTCCPVSYPFFPCVQDVSVFNTTHGRRDDSA